MDEDCINWTEHFGVNTEKRRTELDTSAFIGEKTKHDFIAFRFVVNFVKKKMFSLRKYNERNIREK